VFKIRTFLDPAIQAEWMDRPEMPLERQLTEILAVLAIAGPLLEKSRIKAEEEQGTSTRSRSQKN
jgi:hypothetical protein